MIPGRVISRKPQPVCSELPRETQGVRLRNIVPATTQHRPSIANIR
jgi:hypothetical protein